MTAGTPFPNNFRNGYTPLGSPLGAVTNTVMLTADNTQVTLEGVTLMYLQSDSTTASQRTFTVPVSGLIGHVCTIMFTSAGSTTCQLLNTGTVSLQGDWEPIQYDCVQLVSTGTHWVEICRGAAMTTPSSIVNADIAAGAAIAFSKLADLTSAHILVGSAGNVPTDVAVTGDVTITNGGVTAVGAGKVLLAMLGSGIAPAYVTKYAGNLTTVGGSATEAFTVSGVAATDILTVTMKTQGTGSRTILSAAPTTNTITIVFSGDPSSNHVIAYSVQRAAT